VAKFYERNEFIGAYRVDRTALAEASQFISEEVLAWTTG